MYKRFLLPIVLGATLLAGCGGGDSASNSAQDAQKTVVRAHLNDVYLWYNRIVDVPPANYSTAPDYFDALIVKSVDRFSFSMPLSTAVSQLQEGMETGYGVKWGWGAANGLFAFYVDPNSPAAASISRGTEIISINGQQIANLPISYLNSTLFPEQTGNSVNLTLRPPGASATQTRAFTSATFPTTTVAHPLILPLSGGGKAGYLLFNEHLFTAESGLNQAMTLFKQQGINELVLDLRYNTGGYLMIAEEVASMIGGTNVQGKIFEKLQFNDKHPEKTQDPSATLLFNALDSKGTSLPMLGLTRVFVLTGPNTCSASESIINGLMPYVRVILVGRTTCGKPYGMVQTNFSDQAYFAIQYQGVNASGSDNFTSGFAPNCTVNDDLNYQLGDVREGSLKAALYYVDNKSCPATLPKAVPSGYLPSGDEMQMIGLKPGLKLVK